MAGRIFGTIDSVRDLADYGLINTSSVSFTLDSTLHWREPGLKGSDCSATVWCASILTAVL